LRAGLSRATLAGFDNDVLSLHVPDPPAAEVIKRDLATVKKAIVETTGRSVEVRVAVGSGGAAPAGSASSDDDEHPDDLMRYALEKLR
jgi:hypothetical protein